jgi:AcrR family transcriptional regulator
MEERYFEDGVRTRLILAGLDELCRHGVRDFSLRRVALAAQVSCAAPYRHFKDKDELILEIIRYIFSKWELLCREIESAFSCDPARLVVELAAANVGFWVANGNFRSVLMLEAGADAADGAREELRRFDAPIISAISEYARGVALPAERVRELEFHVTSLVYGTVMLVASGKEPDSVRAVALLREQIARLLK